MKPKSSIGRRCWSPSTDTDVWMSMPAWRVSCGVPAPPVPSLRQLDLERNFTFNMARHMWASRARRKDIPMSVIREELGYVSEKTTHICQDEPKVRRIDKADSIVTPF